MPHFAPGEFDTGNENLVAHFERADFFFGEGDGKLNHGQIRQSFFRDGLSLRAITDSSARSRSF